MSLYLPFVTWNNENSRLRPGVPRTNYAESQPADKREHLAKNKYTYFLRAHELIDVSFIKQTDAQLASWKTFWADVRDGRQFVYRDDDSYRRAGEGHIAGTGKIAGALTSGGTDNQRPATMEGNLEWQEDDVFGYWIVTLHARKVQ